MSGDETSICSSYTVVYTLEKKSWVVAGGNGWSEIHLYRDDADETYRVVAWTVKNQDVLMNCNVTSDCIYKQKAPDFHKFVDENGVQYGLGFHKGDRAAAHSQKFLEMMTEIIAACRRQERALARHAQSRLHSASISVSTAHQHNRAPSLVPIQDIPMGKLQIVPAKPAKMNDADRGPYSITDPWGIVHTKHATYDVFSRKYEGVPQEWLSELQKQFGVAPKTLESIKVPGYDVRLPAILVQMRSYLYDKGGLDVEGIFRLAPDADESGSVKQQLNDGTFKDCRDVNCIANLLKVWFRDLPQSILSCVPAETVASATEEDQVSKVLLDFPEPNKTIMLWLLDICADVSENSNVNRMTAQNLAIVIAPNLYYANNLEPLQQLMQSQKVANFLHKAILWRARTRPEVVKRRFRPGASGAAPHQANAQASNGDSHHSNSHHQATR